MRSSKYKIGKVILQKK